MTLLSGCKTLSDIAASAPQAMTPILRDVSDSGQCSDGAYVTPGSGVRLVLTHHLLNTLAVSDTTIPNQRTTVVDWSSQMSAPPANQPSYTLTLDTDSPDTMVETDTIEISPTAAQLRASTLREYRITETSVNPRYKSDGPSQPLVITVRFQSPLSGQNASCFLPAAPTGLSATEDRSASGTTGDVNLSWNAVAWLQSGGRAASEGDEYDVELSPDPAFLSPQTLLDGFPGPCRGAPTCGNPPVLPGMNSAPFCKAASGAVDCNPSGYVVPWGEIDSPSVDTVDPQAAAPLINKLYVRVRTGFYGAKSAWSNAVTFTPPAPVQFVAPTGTPDQCQDGYTSASGFACLPWQPVEHASGYQVEVAEGQEMQTLGFSSLPAAGTVNSEQSYVVGTSSNDPGEPWCFVPSFLSGITNPFPWCALSSAYPNAKTEAYFLTNDHLMWMVRALYPSGQHGPWSGTFPATWSGVLAQNPASQSFTDIGLQMHIDGDVPPDPQGGLWVFGEWVGNLAPTDATASGKSAFGAFVPTSLPTGPVNTLTLSKVANIKFTAASFAPDASGTGAVSSLVVEKGLREGLWMIGLVYVDKCSDQRAFLIQNVPIWTAPGTVILPNYLELEYVSGTYNYSFYNLKLSPPQKQWFVNQRAAQISPDLRPAEDNGQCPAAISTDGGGDNGGGG